MVLLIVFIAFIIRVIVNIFANRYRLRYTLNNPKANTLLAALPSDLRSVLVTWTRYIDTEGNQTNASQSVSEWGDAITLLTEFEVFGARTYANQYEQNYQTQLAFFAAGNSKTRYKHNALTTTTSWWLSSPSCEKNFRFCAGSGSAKSLNAMRAYALAPAFMT